MASPPVRVAGKLLLGDAARRYKIARDHAATRGLKLRFLATSGTSFRAAAISQVVRRSTSRIVGHAALHARLVPEPGNAYDRRALRVEVAGEHVGYVPRGTCVKPSAAVRVIKVGMEPVPHVWLVAIEPTRKPLAPRRGSSAEDRAAARALVEMYNSVV